MILYGSSYSPFARKALFFLGEKGIGFEHVPLAFHDPLPAFQAASPFGKIPALEDGDFRLSDSSAICHYLERKYPAPALMPQEARAYGQAVWYDKFSDTMLVPALGKVFFNLFVKPRLLKQEPDLAVVAKALEKEIPPLYDFLEGRVDGPFLVGGALSLADIAVATPFFNMAVAGHPLDVSRWPCLGAYVAGIQARPAFATLSDMPKAG
jgi:glutathione S-transferase